MFTGHFAVALSGAGASRRLPLWLLIAAAFCGDLVEAGVAAFYVDDPLRGWSHSVPATFVTGAVLALGWRMAGGNWREAGVLLLVALSHTALDFVTAVKTVWPGLPPAGLFLYRFPIVDGVIEAALCVLGWLAWRASVPAGRRIDASVRAMLVTLLALQAAATFHLMVNGAGPSDGLSKFIR